MIFAAEVGIIIFMMKVMVISDTHRNIKDAKNVLQQDKSITHVIHLGDMVRDADELQEAFSDKSFCKIRGNNDWREFARDSVLLSLCGHNIFATHGHAFGVKSGYLTLARYAKSLGCDVALFGHTHVFADESIDGVRCLNPSSKGYILITDDDIKFFNY